MPYLEEISGEYRLAGEMLRLDLAPEDGHSLSAPEDGHSLSDPESVWISVGRWERDRFTFATDDVTVISDGPEAARTRIMTSPRSPALSTPHDKSGPTLTAEEMGASASTP